jgi:hypothetical protein
MADDPRHPRDLSPEEVASRVAAILVAAERDARAIVAAARREVPEELAVAVAPEPPSVRQHPNGASPDADPLLRAVLEAVESLGARMDHLEATIKGRIDLLWRPVSRPLADDNVQADGAPDEEPAPDAPDDEPDEAPAPDAPATAGNGNGPEADVCARAEQVRAVELALRGFSREQIAAQLRFSLPSEEIERLLDEVLETP